MTLEEVMSNEKFTFTSLENLVHIYKGKYIQICILNQLTVQLRGDMTLIATLFLKQCQFAFPGNATDGVKEKFKKLKVLELGGFVTYRVHTEKDLVHYLLLALHAELSEMSDCPSF